MLFRSKAQDPIAPAGWELSREASLLLYQKKTLPTEAGSVSPKEVLISSPRKDQFFNSGLLLLSISALVLDLVAHHLRQLVY